MSLLELTLGEGMALVTGMLAGLYALGAVWWRRPERLVIGLAAVPLALLAAVWGWRLATLGPLGALPVASLLWGNAAASLLAAEVAVAVAWVGGGRLHHWRWWLEPRCH